MRFLARLLDNLVGWPALERTPLGVISPIEGMDDVVERWRRSFFEGVHDASPPDTTASADGQSDVGGGGSPAEDVTVPPAGEPQPTGPEICWMHRDSECNVCADHDDLWIHPNDLAEDWEDDGCDEIRRQTVEHVWERRLGQRADGGAGSNLKVDKFGDVYEDPAQPPDPDPHLTIAEVYVRIDELSEQFDRLLLENETIRRDHARTLSELRQAVAQLRIAREQRDDHLAKLKRLQQNR